MLKEGSDCISQQRSQVAHCSKVVLRVISTARNSRLLHVSISDNTLHRQCVKEYFLLNSIDLDVRGDFGQIRIVELFWYSVDRRKLCADTYGA